MKNKYYFTIISILTIQISIAQSKSPTSAEADTTKVINLLQSSKENFSEAPEKSIVLAQTALNLANSINYTSGASLALKNIGIAYYYQGNDLEALDYWEKSLASYKSTGDRIGESNILNNIGAIYFNQGDDAKALEYYLNSLSIAEKMGDTLRKLTAYNNIGGVYNNKIATKDKALSYFLKALPLAEALNDTEALGTTAVNIGEIYFEQNNDEKALFYYDKSVKAYNNSENSPYVYNAIGKLFYREKKYDQAISYHERALGIAKKLNGNLDIVQSLIGLGNVTMGKNDYKNGFAYLKESESLAVNHKFNKELKDIYKLLASTYSKIDDYKNAYFYQTKYSGIKDTLYNIEADQKLSSLQFDFEMLKKQGEINLLMKDKEVKEIALKRQRNALIGFVLGALAILLIAINLYRTILKLKAAQTQLIQSEKMASLGELTAGIAHEIQNPLNFVNNFSEVSNEMLEEVLEERNKGKGDRDEVLEEEILADLKENISKINHHGKRASDIVKSMLEHSRKSSGEKTPTDINALCDEYLRLSYHGLRAKDKSFNASFELSTDENIPKAKVVQQDIGRVILNIINNAFYSVNERKKSEPESYNPTVLITTKKTEGNHVLISINDNGIGMPKDILAKIFQPFFTTKPTGQGTGLGLSLSYDIVKAHGGELKVESKEGVGTTFTIQLPV